MNNKTVLLAKPLEPSKEAFEKLGFTFSKCDIPNLIEATIPEGWSVVRRNDGVISTVIIYDQKNRIRAHSYEVCSSYSEILSGHTGLFCRYSIKSIYLGGKNKNRKYEIAVCENTPIVNGDTDPLYDKKIFSAGRSKDILVYDCNTKKYLTEHRTVKKCVKFMEQNYPNWNDPLAYWD